MLCAALLTGGCGGDDDDNGAAGSTQAAGGQSGQSGSAGAPGGSGQGGAGSSGASGASSGSAGAAGVGGGAGGSSGGSGQAGAGAAGSAGAGQAGAGQAGAGGEPGAGAGGESGASGQSGQAGAGGEAAGAGGAGSGGAGAGGQSPGGAAGAGTAGAGTAGAGTAGAGTAGASAAGAAGGPGAGGAAGSAAGTSGTAGTAGTAGAAGGASGAAGSGDPVPLTTPPFDWVGVIGTGQSLSVGAASGEVITKTQPYKNIRLVDTGAAPQYPLDGSGTYATAPLTEPPRATASGTGIGYSDGQYPNNLAGETPHSSMANQISATWTTRGGKGDYITAHTPVGWSGHALVCIDKSESTVCTQSNGPTTSYRGAMAEAKAFKKLATAAGKTFGYGAVVLTHGETDAGNPAYGAGIVQLQHDYEADLRAITGQTQAVPMLVSQQSTTGGANSSAVQVWRAGVDHPGAIVCTGPKYAFQYAADDLHLPSAGYVQLGEKYAEVFDLIVNQGVAWRPLEPDPDKSPSVQGVTISVPFHVPNPPLSFEDTAPKNHQTKNTEWAKGRGFEVTDGSGKHLTIVSVSIFGSSVAITLDKAPDKTAGLVVGYALTQDDTGNQGGLTGGLHGDLRDSDNLIGLDSEMIQVQVEKGSTSVKSTASGQFLARTGRDIVMGTGLSTSATVTLKVSDDELTLSEPWPGTTGKTSLSFHHDLRNYAVHFSLPVSF